MTIQCCRQLIQLVCIPLAKLWMSQHATPGLTSTCPFLRVSQIASGHTSVFQGAMTVNKFFEWH
jgi:hypothetical protein